MIRKSPDDLQFATLRHSEQPPQAQMAVAVRASFRLVPDGLAERIDDVMDAGFISGYRFAEGANPLTDAPICPSDLTPPKPGAEVVLTGTCHAPGGTPVPSCPVRITVGNFVKELVVHGDRGWKPTALGKQPTEPAPFTAMPLTWDRAFGGPAHPANPVGRSLDNELLPNIEYADQLIRSGTDSPPTAGFGPRNPEWPVRARMRGKNYGKEYNETRAPWYSDDFDPAFFFSAPGDQQLDDPFVGTEEITLLNLNPGHEVLTTTMPGLRPRAFVNDRERNFREVALVLDTVWIEAAEERLHLVWRGLTDVQDVDHADVDIVYVELVALDHDKPAAEYEAVLDKWEADPAGVQDLLPEGYAEAVAQAEEAMKAGQSLADVSAQAGEAAGANPLSKAVAAVMGPMAAGDQQAMAQEIDRVAASDIGPVTGQDFNPALSDAMAAAPPPGPPPAVPATWGIKPRVSLSDEWTALKDQRDQFVEMGLDPEKIAEIDAVVVDPMWADQDPALAGKVNAFRAEAGMDPVPVEQGPDKGNLPAAVATALAAGAGAFVLARIATGLIPPPALTPMGVPECAPGLHGPLGLDFGRQKRDLVDEDLSNLDLNYEDFTDCNLYGANLSNSSLEGVSFRGANLEYANLYNCNLAGADFTGANLYMANLGSANAREAKFVDTFIEAAVFNNARMAGANLKGAVGAYAQFQEARLTGAFGEGLHVPGGNFDRAILNGASFKGADFTRASFNSVTAENLDLSDATLTRLSAPDSNMVNARFTCAVAPDSNWVGTDLESADFTACTLHRAFFQDARLAKATMEWADLRQARLRKAILDFARFGRANLHEADLGMASCVETNFANANLFHTTLHEATLSNCEFTGTNLNRALIRQTS